MKNNRTTRKKTKMALRRYIPADHMPTMKMIHRGIEKYKGALNYATREIRREYVLKAMDKAINGLMIHDHAQDYRKHLEDSRFSFSTHIQKRGMEVINRDKPIYFINEAKTA